MTQALTVLPVHFCEQPESDDKDSRGGHHGPMTHRFSEVKCPKCGWVHVAIPMDVARENSDTDEDLERYLKCFRCGAPTLGFVPALEGDAPMGCTLQAVVLTASD
jgi:rubredoxin